jgi:murein DD-endopeptidase MepM/ murein hydrolase activator NlpD
MKKTSLLFCLLVSLNAFGQNAGGVSMIPPLAVMGNINQGYGQSTNVITGEPWFHGGIDISARTGTPVLAVMSGVVAATGEHNALGIYVIINHENNYQTLYAQLAGLIAVKGQHVTRGETIALSGNTGLSTGPHLHFSVCVEGETVDPLSVLGL